MTVWVIAMATTSMEFPVKKAKGYFNFQFAAAHDLVAVNAYFKKRITTLSFPVEKEDVSGLLETFVITISKNHGL